MGFEIVGFAIVDCSDLVEARGDGVDVHVHVQPRAGRDAIVGRHGAALKVRVTAPPLDGRANDAVCRLVADALGVRPSAVRVVGGSTSRVKRLRVDGVVASAVAARLAYVIAGR